MRSDRPAATTSARGGSGPPGSADANGRAPTGVELAVRQLMAEPARYFPEAEGPPRVLAMSIARRRLSEIARVEVALGRSATTIYVKAHRNPNAPPARLHRKARLEFDTLSHLYERFGPVPGCAVVRPIAFLPDYLAVVTEAGTGENLHRLVKKCAVVWGSRAAMASAMAHCRGAGVWLRHFQTITDQGRQEPLPLGQWLEWIEADVALCVKLGLSTSDGAGLVDSARARIAALADRRFAVVGQHPDYQPDNVLVSPRGVTVLDFTSFQYGSPISDVARFVASLDFLGKSPLFPRRRLRVLAAAFLGGVGEDTTAIRPALVLSLIHHMVRAARTVASWPRSPLLKGVVERQTMRFLAGWQRELATAGDAFIDVIRAADPSRPSGWTARRETTL